MEPTTALIMTVGGIAGSIVVTQLFQLNWFKRENFKIKKKNILDENRLKIKKLEKELGLTHSRPPAEETSKLGMLKDVLPVLSKLDSDQIAGLADRFLGGSETSEGTVGLSDLALGFVEEHPEVLEGLLQGISKVSSKNDINKESTTGY